MFKVSVDAAMEQEKAMAVVESQKSLLEQANETEQLARVELERIQAKYSLDAAGEAVKQQQVLMPNAYVGYWSELCMTAARVGATHTGVHQVELFIGYLHRTGEPGCNRTCCASQYVRCRL